MSGRMANGARRLRDGGGGLAIGVRRGCIGADLMTEECVKFIIRGLHSQALWACFDRRVAAGKSAARQIENLRHGEGAAL